MAEQQPKNRVLIVDDDQTLCEMYAERLKAEGYEVVVAHNGEEGAAKAVEYLPQVILLDLMMPKVNGFNTLEILKSNEETKNIPVLILTALIQEENKQRGLQAGAEGYIIKSETMPGDVIEKIKAAIEKGRQRQQSAAGGGQAAPSQSQPMPMTSDSNPGATTPTMDSQTDQMASSPTETSNPSNSVTPPPADMPAQETTNPTSPVEPTPTPENPSLPNTQESSTPQDNIPDPIGTPPVSETPPSGTDGSVDNDMQQPSEPVNNQTDPNDVPKPSTPPVAPPPPPAQ